MAISKSHSKNPALPLLRVVSQHENVPVRIDRVVAVNVNWEYWEPKFRKTRASLLLDDVDAVEERHMELRPDDRKSKAAKLLSHKYKYNTKERAYSSIKKMSCHISTPAMPRPRVPTVRFSSI